MKRVFISYRPKSKDHVTTNHIHTNYMQFHIWLRRNKFSCMHIKVTLYTQPKFFLDKGKDLVSRVLQCNFLKEKTTLYSRTDERREKPIALTYSLLQLKNWKWKKSPKKNRIGKLQVVIILHFKNIKDEIDVNYWLFSFAWQIRDLTYWNRKRLKCRKK